VKKAPIPFKPFDEFGELRIYYQGILPHWRQDGCTYFVTFRTGDSIPKAVLEELEHERVCWLTARGIDPNVREWKHRFALLSSAERRQYEKLVGRLLNTTLDQCHGSCVLRDATVGRIVADALDYFHGDRVITGDYVVMPNHVHALMTPINGVELEDILQSIKSFTSKRINRALGRVGGLWQRDSYDHIVRDFEQLQAYQRYIADNGPKAQLPQGAYILAQADYYSMDL
jgi:putative transposase